MSNWPMQKSIPILSRQALFLYRVSYRGVAWVPLYKSRSQNLKMCDIRYSALLSGIPFCLPTTLSVLCCAYHRHLAKCSTSTFVLVKSSACAIVLASSYETCSSGLWLLGFRSPLLLHRALASCASAYCSDDLAIVSTLSHPRILA